MPCKRESSVDFENLVIDFEDYTVLLDVDGTLVNDGADTLSHAVVERINEIIKKNLLIICSNKSDSNRKNKLEKQYNLKFAETKFKKPSKKILQTLPAEKKILVIGDKLLIDGLFAFRINAKFVKVRRKMDGSEPFAIRGMYLLDDIVSYFLKV